VTPLAGGGEWALAIGSPGFIERRGIALPEALDSAVRSARADGLTAVAIAVDGHARAVAALGDRVRDDSAAAVAALRRMGFEPSIYSGDAQAVVTQVAAHVGVSTASGEVMPEQKLDAVRRSTARLTVMVGDGVNDAAALAAADVGVAVHGGAEASLAAADVYCAAPGLTPLVDLVRTCRRTMSTIRRNLLVSLAYNLLAGALAATGVMNPMIAAILMPLSSATVLSLAVASVTRDASTPRRRGGAA
jgi:P-type E1-E2 ATPase